MAVQPQLGALIFTLFNYFLFFLIFKSSLSRVFATPHASKPARKISKAESRFAPPNSHARQQLNIGALTGRGGGPAPSYLGGGGAAPSIEFSHGVPWSPPIGPMECPSGPLWGSIECLWRPPKTVPQTWARNVPQKRPHTPSPQLLPQMCFV